MADLNVAAMNLWSPFVQRVHEIIRTGLESLAVDSSTNKFFSCNENDLNRELFFRVRRVALIQKKNLFSVTPLPPLSREHTWHLAPTFEANSQPSPDDPLRMPREDKRPDFQWSFQDDLADDLDRATRTYVVECKRLGHAIGSWILNTNYVVNGVLRFINASHLYAKDDTGGCMIGYVQSMDIGTIHREVTSQFTIEGLTSFPKPELHPGSAVLHVTLHDLTRTNACSPFRLHHFWVDLRPRSAAVVPSQKRKRVARSKS